MKMEKKRLKDIAEIERAIAGKIYPQYTPMIALSASMTSDKGGIAYLKEAGEVESRYAVFLPKDEELEPLYLYYIMLSEYDEFFAKHNTNINLQIGELDHYFVYIHKDKKTRLLMVEALKGFDEEIEKEAKMLEQLGNVKKYLLKNLFPE